MYVLDPFLRSEIVLKLGGVLMKNLTEKFKILLNKFGFELILTEHDLRMLAGLQRDIYRPYVAYHL